MKRPLPLLLPDIDLWKPEQEALEPELCAEEEIFSSSDTWGCLSGMAGLQRHLMADRIAKCPSR